MWDEKDEDGRYYVRDLVQKAKDGGGWVDIKPKIPLNLIMWN